MSTKSIRPAVPCRARRQDGEPCRNWAEHGQAVCRVHGGAAPQSRRAAARRLREEAARVELARLAIDVDPSVDPAEALLRSVAATAQMVRYIRATVEEGVNELGADALTQVDLGPAGASRVAPSAMVELLHTWETLHARVCAAALKAGVEERRVRLAEVQAAQIVEVLKRSLTDLGLDPAAADVGQVVARHLRAVEMPRDDG